MREAASLLLQSKRNIRREDSSQKTADGPLLITTDCVTLRELEDQINQLKSELEAILKEARARFAADDRRQAARAGNS